MKRILLLFIVLFSISTIYSQDNSKDRLEKTEEAIAKLKKRKTKWLVKERDIYLTSQSSIIYQLASWRAK